MTEEGVSVVCCHYQLDSKCIITLTSLQVYAVIEKQNATGACVAGVVVEPVQSEGGKNAEFIWL